MTLFHTKRAAFSMVTAIFVILLMASVAAMVMNLSGKVVQETTAQYRKEQAILLAKSYTEFAIMTATAQDCAPLTITGGDVDSISKIGEGYQVVVQTRYIGANSACKGVGDSGNIRLNDADNITTPESIDGSILVDVFVKYRNPEDLHAINDDAWTNPSRGITYHRRTLQRL